MLARAQDASDQGCVLIIPTNNLRIPELREMRPDVNTPMVGNEYRQAGAPWPVFTLITRRKDHGEWIDGEWEGGQS